MTRSIGKRLSRRITWVALGGVVGALVLVAAVAAASDNTRAPIRSLSVRRRRADYRDRWRR
jgi:hypothetical protein